MAAVEPQVIRVGIFEKSLLIFFFLVGFSFSYGLPSSQAQVQNSMGKNRFISRAEHNLPVEARVR